MQAKITLPDELYVDARRKAILAGVSLSDYIERLVERDIEQEPPVVDPSIIFNLFSGGGSDIAEVGKQAMLGEASARNNS